MIRYMQKSDDLERNSGSFPSVLTMIIVDVAQDLPFAKLFAKWLASVTLCNHHTSLMRLVLLPYPFYWIWKQRCRKNGQIVCPDSAVSKTQPQLGLKLLVLQGSIVQNNERFVTQSYKHVSSTINAKLSVGRRTQRQRAQSWEYNWYNPSRWC